MRNDTFACPNCGELLPPKAKACRACGSDENTGWSENTYLDGVSMPFEDDDYEEIRAKEFGGAGGRSGAGKIHIDWKMIVGAVVLAAMVMAFVCR
jgi:hypothetical protein